MRPAVVTFVGLGPGDPRSITVRAAEALASARAVVVDEGRSAELVAELAPASDRVVVSGAASAEAVARALADRAAPGAVVVRALEGDGVVFGRLVEEVDALARLGVGARVVPGLAPLVVAGSHGGVVLSRPTDASPSVAALRVCAGHEGLFAWPSVAHAADVLVLDCDVAAVAEASRSLVHAGLSPDTPAVALVDAALPTQRREATTLGRLAAPSFAGPRVLLAIGARAVAPPALRWFEALPLFGRRVVITRAAEQAADLAVALEELGARCVHFPTITIADAPDRARLLRAAREVGGYRWVVFTSQNGARRFFAALDEVGADARAFGAARVAAIGPATARALAERGVRADLVPARFVGESLAEELVAAIAAGGGRVLLARALVARDVVPDALRAAGCEVDVVAAYETRPAAARDVAALAGELESGAIDALTFTSPSTVESFASSLAAAGGDVAALAGRAVVATIGPVTSERARALGLRVDVEAEPHTREGLVEALAQRFDGAALGQS